MTATARELIQQTAALFIGDGDVVEIRALHTKQGTVSGYYSDRAAFVRDACAVDGKGPGVYVTLNRVAPIVLARAVNRLRPYAQATTSDTEIDRRLWVLFDCDPVRPAGISASDAEHAAAMEMANKIAVWLVTLGVPSNAIVIADSGNGAHVLLRVDLPNDPKTLDLVKRVLAAVDLEWTNEQVQVDTSVHNAARIVRLYGTTAQKGDATADRPHRRSALVTVPESIVPAPLEVIQRLAARAPLREPAEVPKGPARALLDVDAFVRTNLSLHHVRQRPDGATVYVVDCPWRDHTDGAAYVMRLASGAVAAGCHHNSCQEENWRSLRGRFDAKASQNGTTSTTIESTLEAAGIAALTAASPPDVVEAALRALADSLKDADGIRRAAMRSAAVTMLKSAKLVNATKLVEAALRGAPMPSDTGQGSGALFAETEPWPDAVDLSTLLAEIAATYRRYLILPPCADTALALWTVHTHIVVPNFDSPYLFVTAPTKQSGKSRLLEVAQCLVSRPLMAAMMTVATLFRTVEEHHPTLLLDEHDSDPELKETMRGVLNAGNRPGVRVPRCAGDNNEVKWFDIFCAKAIAGIGRLHDTTEDRSIIIEMRRRRADEPIERFRRDHVWAACERLRRQAARCAEDLHPALLEADPTMPPELSDRGQDKWRILIAIADLAGPPWDADARLAAIKLSGATPADERDGGCQILADLQQLFADHGDLLASDFITKKLVGLEHRPWSEWSKGKELSVRGLATLVGRFKTPAGVAIRSKTIRPTHSGSGDTAKGYDRKDFEDAFERYVTALAPNPSVTPSQPLGDKGQSDVGDLSHGSKTAGCDGSETGTSAYGDKGCDGVTDSEPSHDGSEREVWDV